MRQTGGITRLTDSIKIVSLLQPPPETFALFDGLVLLADGRVIYSGPVDNVVPYFETLGYVIPDRMDVADWLQVGTLLELFSSKEPRIRFLMN